MAACSACNTTILFGGVTDGNDRYCNNECHGRGYLLSVARQIPHDIVREQTDSVFHGMCPKCSGPGPVEVHKSYRVWSALLLTSWVTRQHVSCRSCGVKAQIGDLLFSGVLGWWGFPWGLIMTPVQVVRNLNAMFRSASPQAPSDDLQQLVSITLAADAIERQAS